MSRIFKIDRKPFGDEIIYAKASVTIEPGVTVLVGCNGTGKSTLMFGYIESFLRSNHIPVISYNNLFHGGDNARQEALLTGKMKLLTTLAISSEGEQIIVNMGTAARKIGDFVRKYAGEPEIWILLDAIDSGLSIDNIIDIKEDLFKTIIETNPNTDVYILVSANNYEMCRGEKCLDVRQCKYREFKTYDSYRKFVMKSKEYKRKRYEGK